MGHEFETDNEITVDATPEQVWEAIATGPGIDSWFMGRNEVEAGQGGRMRMVVSDYFTAESTITAWDPPNRLAYRSAEADDGSFMAFEFLVEGRDQGSTVVRLVHNGFLGGDDWEAEYDALRKGDPMYLRSLGTYLTYFPGRTATPVSAWGPQQPTQDEVWAGFKRGLGLSGTVAEGDAAQFTLDGSRVKAVVDSVLVPSFLGVRADDGLYRFVGGGGSAGVGHHIFAPVNQAEAERAWRSWLTDLFA
ncbi:MAG TPA: SRPBCC domain-containing protein [Jiangellaceae bacterium]